MPKQIIPMIMSRIATATEESKISVFTCETPGVLDAYFDSVYWNRQMAKSSPNYIGTYCKDDNLSMVEEFLNKHLK